MITGKDLVKDVIEKYPKTKEVFAAHGLDMCCGGIHPIAIAADAHGIDRRGLLGELNGALRKKAAP